MAKNRNKVTQKLSGIQWRFLKVQWRIILAITAFFYLGLLLAATTIQYSPSLLSSYAEKTSIALFSNTYFLFITTMTAFVFVISAAVSLLYSYRFAKYVKNQLEQLVDSARLFTRGKLSTRVQAQGTDEFAQLSEQFNAMTEHYEKHVLSLQKLLNENSQLVEQAEQAAALEERRKLARDLHDAVSQQLFAISMTMAALPKLIEKNEQQAAAVATNIEKMVNNAQQELRALIMHLRPVTLDGKSFKEGIHSLIEELKIKNEHLQVKMKFQLTTLLPSIIEDQIFRIIQEAISNMLRHSKATFFEMKLYENDESCLIIIIEDNGVGFIVEEMEKKGSYGLTTMKERIIELGGHLEILSYPNKGTKLQFRVPIRLEKV